MGQEFASSSAGWFWLKISHEVSVKMLAGAGTVGRFDWDWGVCSFMSLARGYWLLAGDLRSGHEDVSVVCLSVIRARQHSHQRVQERTRQKQQWFYDLALEVQLHYSCIILLVTDIIPLQGRRGPCWSLATT